MNEQENKILYYFSASERRRKRAEALKIRETGSKRQHRFREGAGVLSVHMGKGASRKQQGKKRNRRGQDARTEGKGEGREISGQK